MKKILITRSVHQATELSKAISDKGHIPILFPTLKIEPPEDLSPALKVIKNLDRFDIAIFTSANAILYLPFFSNPLPTKIIAIGPATAKALQQAGIRVNNVAASPFSSESLLKLNELQQIFDKKIVIFTGAGGRPFLLETLKQQGADVQITVTYKRQLPQGNFSKMLEKAKDIDVIIVTSLEGLKNLFILLESAKEILIQKTIIVISKKMIEFAQSLGFSKIILAENASNVAVIACFKEI